MSNSGRIEAVIEDLTNLDWNVEQHFLDLAPATEEVFYHNAFVDYKEKLLLLNFPSSYYALELVERVKGHADLLEQLRTNDAEMYEKLCEEVSIAYVYTLSPSEFFIHCEEARGDVYSSSDLVCELVSAEVASNLKRLWENSRKDSDDEIEEPVENVALHNTYIDIVADIHNPAKHPDFAFAWHTLRSYLLDHVSGEEEKEVVCKAFNLMTFELPTTGPDTFEVMYDDLDFTTDLTPHDMDRFHATVKALYRKCFFDSWTPPVDLF